MFQQYEDVAQRLYTVENSAFYKSCDTPGHIPGLYTFLLAIATRYVGAPASGQSFNPSHLVFWGKPSAGKSIHTKLNLDIFSCAKDPDGVKMASARIRDKSAFVGYMQVFPKHHQFNSYLNFSAILIAHFPLHSIPHFIYSSFAIHLGAHLDNHGASTCYSCYFCAASTVAGYLLRYTQN